MCFKRISFASLTLAMSAIDSIYLAFLLPFVGDVFRSFRFSKFTFISALPFAPPLRIYFAPPADPEKSMSPSPTESVGSCILKEAKYLL